MLIMLCITVYSLLSLRRDVVCNLEVRHFHGPAFSAIVFFMVCHFRVLQIQRPRLYSHLPKSNIAIVNSCRQAVDASFSLLQHLQEVRTRTIYRRRRRFAHRPVARDNTLAQISQQSYNPSQPDGRHR